MPILCRPYSIGKMELTQSLVIPSKTIAKVQSIAYKNSFGLVAWEDMTFPYKEEGVGLKDFYDVHQASIVERASKVRIHEEIWANCM